MFFILSKTLDVLLSPIVWILLLLVYGILKGRRTYLLAAMGLLLFFTSPFFVNGALLMWERQPVSLVAGQTYDTAIVLSGFTTARDSTPGRVYFNKGADRLLHTVSLYKQGKIKRILISGGSGSLRNRQLLESRQIRRAFIYCGVPDSAILVEDRSSNTVENARFSKELIGGKVRSEDMLLITSAFHMRRAEDCFIKAGLNPDIYPVDFYSKEQILDPALLIPSEAALEKWSILIHEIFGYFVYKILGYA